MIKNYSVFIKIFLISIFFFLIFDATIGKYIYKKFIREQLQDIDINFSKFDEYYDHKYPKNFNAIGGWGNIRYKICTDNNSFRTSCKTNKKNLKSFDLAFIGDSFTDGIGFEYEKTFVGIIDKELNQKKIANLGVSSYSTSIYFTKMNKLINDGYKFKEVVVFVDLSDLPDDVLCYEVKNKKIKRKDNFENCWNNFNIKNNELLDFFDKNFKISKLLINNVYNLFNENNINSIQKNNVFNNSRSEWTYKYEKSNFNNLEFDKAINISITNMNNLYELLQKNLIELSVAVYPWPGTLKHDKVNNKQVEIWKNFCNQKCKKFYNLMPPFFEDNYEESYKKFYIENDVHFNELGNKIIAQNFLTLYKK